MPYANNETRRLHYVANKERFTQERESEKEHRREYNKAYRAANLESLRAKKRVYERERYATHRDRINAMNKVSHRRRKYGLSAEDVSALIGKQLGCCAICKRALSMVPKRPDTCCIDHCHESGRVRGLLCNHCNQGIGLLDDSPDRLQSAVNYLRRNDSCQA